MTLSDYYQYQGGQVCFSRPQASRFAKEIANDFNPLHDTDAKMFCVPGDLLFSVALERLGLSQQMRFTFSGMVSEEPVTFPDTNAKTIEVTDAGGKCYVTIERDGEISRDQQLITRLAGNYVAFSGKTFPYLLVPLMSQQGVMINPTRPLVIYQRMEIGLGRLDLTQPELEPTGSAFEVAGKKGTVRLDFDIRENGTLVGHGAKHMSLRGLQPYDDDAMSGLVEQYNGYRTTYQSGI